MKQVLSVWSALDMRRRVIVILATVAMFAAVLGISRIATQPSMALLYSGLEAGAAGEVVAALEAEGVVYEVRGTSIFVDAPRRDELRLALASQGLPADTTQGYELLDSLTGFGTTSQMFDAAYWRAKEGELARTIVANPQIQTARVHIANASGRPFARAENLTASVTVTTRGGTLSKQTAKALQYLVASAVAGLSPASVSIIDSAGGLIGGEEFDASASGDEKSAELRRNVERLLEARVGVGNAMVEVAVETETQRESIVEKRFDPNERVAISSESEEVSSQANDTENGNVTVASNLPDGDAAGGEEGSSSSRNTQTRERVNYEVSETQREVLRTPGAIKRITVAVLVDGLRTTGENGEATWAPRSEEELASLRELVASTVGFDEARGDTITLKSMEFQPDAAAGTEVSASAFDGMNLDMMSLIQLGVLAVVALALGLFVIRPILASRGAAAPAVPALEGPKEPMELNPLPALGGMGEGFDAAPLPMMADYDLDGTGASPMALGGPAPADAVGRLRKMIEERREETVGVLQSWMEEERA